MLFVLSIIDGFENKFRELVLVVAGDVDVIADVTAHDNDVALVDLRDRFDGRWVGVLGNRTNVVID